MNVQRFFRFPFFCPHVTSTAFLSLTFSLSLSVFAAHCTAFVRGIVRK
jgi:hypothetical protein